MPSKNINFRCPDQQLSYLSSWDSNPGEGRNAPLGGTVRRIIDRYQAIMDDSVPELTEGEWCAICDVLNGCGAWMSADSPDPAPMIWAELYDSEADGVGEKWGIDCKTLAEKLRTLPLASRIAVWDVAARFWANPRLNELTHRELLIEAGAKIA